MKSGRLIALVVVVALVSFLLWSTLSAQKVRCNACVAFQGQRNCASASAASRAEAAKSAQTTACGPVARGMDESIACSNRPPVSMTCSTDS